MLEGKPLVVTPGETISKDPTFMRGHGTFYVGERLCSAVGGTVERVNKLICVKPVRSRYTGEIGDVVIGRIIDVGPKRWRLDTNSRQESALLLSSINLPGAIQRRKSESDELQMRSFFAEGEIICAEVQSLFQDGGFGVHTRNLKYGKLVTGELVAVQASLIRRSRSHFLLFGWGVEVILGLNGHVWIGKPRKTPEQQDLDTLYSSKLEPTSLFEKQLIAKTRNAIVALDRAFVAIDEASIGAVFGLAADTEPKDMTRLDFVARVAEALGK